MLEHMRQYGKAQVKQGEAAAQMSLMRDLEMGQAAKETRVIPKVSNDWSTADFV